MVAGKLEMFNPGGSVKDRTAMNLIRDAEKRGVLRPGGTIVEATSGNTGVGLAVIAAARGYRLILTMPETMSEERRKLLSAYGAELHLTPGELGMQGAVDEAARLLAENPDFFTTEQFNNPANPEIHRLTTAREILEQTGGKIGAFVAGIGTGGTITGVGEVLKEEVPGVKIVGVEPAGSPVLSGGKPGRHAIQGIGAGFVPKVLNTDILDRVIPVSDEDAYEATRRLAEQEGLLVGVSSGAAAWAAEQVAADVDPDLYVVVILPDSGERYLSMKGLFK